MNKSIKIKRALAKINNLPLRKSKRQEKVSNDNWGVIHELMEATTVDIVSADFDIDPRYEVQEVLIPMGKRGNLAPYAGKKVLVVPTTIARRGARINFYICEA